MEAAKKDNFFGGSENQGGGRRGKAVTLRETYFSNFFFSPTTKVPTSIKLEGGGGLKRTFVWLP